MVYYQLACQCARHLAASGPEDESGFATGHDVIDAGLPRAWRCRFNVRGYAENTVPEAPHSRWISPCAKALVGYREDVINGGVAVRTVLFHTHMSL
ncbi:MAG: hypothetical protein H6882_05325 [Rhodobiaceae bacterium]|nr:hypothetical protein [Rhodobiaceae bacterium]